MKRPASARSLLSTAVAALVLLGGCGASAVRRSDPGYGQFAGYAAHERFEALSTSWTVPRVVGGTGGAGTWVGAEAYGDPAPFIQIGTNEERFSRSRRPSYYSFWSDTKHHFRAVPLFAVAAGDQITATLRLTPLHWRLAIVDTTSGASSHFATVQEASASFQDAQWLQEALAPKRTSRVPDYPKLTSVGMHALRIDGRTPRYARVRSSWMSVGDEDLAPSPLRGGAFTVGPAKITAAGERYLQVVKPADEALERFAERAVSWSSKTPRAQTAAELTRLSSALRANVARLSRGTWPDAVSGLIKRLIASEDVQLKELEAQPDHATNAAWRRIVERSTRSEIGLKIRRALHAPELTL